jgi:hypothetical protein
VAIYHFTVKVIKRSHGRSAVAAAAYRSGDRFVDEERAQTFDYPTSPKSFTQKYCCRSRRPNG